MWIVGYSIAAQTIWLYCMEIVLRKLLRAVTSESKLDVHLLSFTTYFYPVSAAETSTQQSLILVNFRGVKQGQMQEADAEAKHLRPRSRPRPEPWGRGQNLEVEAEAKFEKAERNNVLIEYST